MEPNPKPGPQIVRLRPMPSLEENTHRTQRLESGGRLRGISRRITRTETFLCSAATTLRQLLQRPTQHTHKLSLPLSCLHFLLGPYLTLTSTSPGGRPLLLLLPPDRGQLSQEVGNRRTPPGTSRRTQPAGVRHSERL